MTGVLTKQSSRCFLPVPAVVNLQAVTGTLDAAIACSQLTALFLGRDDDHLGEEDETDLATLVDALPQLRVLRLFGYAHPPSDAGWFLSTPCNVLQGSEPSSDPH